jgi:hypothetical protein
MGNSRIQGALPNAQYLQSTERKIKFMHNLACRVYISKYNKNEDKITKCGKFVNTPSRVASCRLVLVYMDGTNTLIQQSTCSDCSRS